MTINHLLLIALILDILITIYSGCKASKNKKINTLQQSEYIKEPNDFIIIRGNDMMDLEAKMSVWLFEAYHKGYENIQATFISEPNYNYPGESLPTYHIIYHKTI